MKITGIPADIVVPPGEFYDFSRVLCETLLLLPDRATSAARPNSYPFFSVNVLEGSLAQPTYGFVNAASCFFRWDVIIQSPSAILARRFSLHVPNKIISNSVIIFVVSRSGIREVTYRKVVDFLPGYNNNNSYTFGPADIVQGSFECGAVTWSIQGDFNPLP